MTYTHSVLSAHKRDLYYIKEHKQWPFVIGFIVLIFLVVSFIIFDLRCFSKVRLSSSLSGETKTFPDRTPLTAAPEVHMYAFLHSTIIIIIEYAETSRMAIVMIVRMKLKQMWNYESISNGIQLSLMMVYWSSQWWHTGARRGRWRSRKKSAFKHFKTSVSGSLWKSCGQN